MKDIKIKGLNCQHCVLAVTNALSSIDGIKDVQVDLKTGLVTYKETQTVDRAIIVAAVKKAGYEVV